MIGGPWPVGPLFPPVYGDFWAYASNIQKGFFIYRSDCSSEFHARWLKRPNSGKKVLFGGLGDAPFRGQP